VGLHPGKMGGGKRGSRQRKKKKKKKKKIKLPKEKKKKKKRTKNVRGSGIKMGLNNLKSSVRPSINLYMGRKM